MNNVLVNLDGRQINVVIESGGLGAAMAVSLTEIAADVARAETAADEAEASAIAAAATLAGKVGYVELAASDGSDLVGFLQDITGASARTAQDKMRDTLAVRDASIAADGTTNDVTAMVAVVTNAAGKKIRIPAGQTIKLNSATVSAYTGDITIEGDGDGSVIDLSAGGSLLLNPGVTQIANLAADIVEGESNIVSFVAPHGLTEGSVFAVWDPTDYSQSPYRAEYRRGDMFRVASVESPTSVRIYGTPRETFGMADVEVYVLNGGTLHLSNVQIIPPATGIPGQFDGFSRVVIHNVTIPPGTEGTGLDVSRCYDVNVSQTNSSALLADAYPIILANSQHGLIHNITGNYSRRHCVSFGGRNGDCTVPTADFIVDSCILENVTSNGIGAADIHGGCKNITYTNCIMEGAVIGGVNPSLINNTIYGRPTSNYPDGTCIVSSEIVGGVYTVDGNRLVSFGNGSSNGLMLFEVGQRTQDFALVGHNTIVNPNAAVRGIHIRVGDSAPPAFGIRVNASFDYVGVSLAQALSVSGANDVTSVMTGTFGWTGPITTPLGASLNANYGIPVSFQPPKTGLKVRGDADATLYAPVDLETQLWSTTLTADRFIALPNDGSAAHGNSFRLIRTAGGSTRVLQVLGTNIWPDMYAVVTYQGSAGGLGSWIVAELGSLSLNTGWTAGTGTANKGAFNADAVSALTFSNPPTQAELNAFRDAVSPVSRRVLSLEQAALNRIISA